MGLDLAEVRMRLACLALVLIASNVQASTILTQIRMSYPLSETGNLFRLSTSESAYLGVGIPFGPHSFSETISAADNANVAALVADMRDGLADTLTLSIGSHSNGDTESWFFGEFDAVDGTGLRRLDYATQDYPAAVTGVDWSNFQIESFHVSAVGPISATLPDRARLVIDVVGRVPEPSTLLLLSTALWLPLRRRCR